MKKMKKIILSLIISASTCAILNSNQVSAEHDPQIDRIVQTYDFEKIKGALNFQIKSIKNLLDAFTTEDFLNFITNYYSVSNHANKDFLVALLNEANGSALDSDNITDDELIAILTGNLNAGNFDRTALFQDINRDDLLQIIITEYPQTFRKLIGCDLNTFEHRLRSGKYFLRDSSDINWREINKELFPHLPIITDIQQNSLTSQSLNHKPEEIVASCYLLTSLQALIYDGRINEIYDLIHDNGDGTVTVTFYDPRTKQKVPYTIKKSVPAECYNQSNAPWVRLVEKAYSIFISELRGIQVKEAGKANYGILNLGGYPTEATINLVGEIYGNKMNWSKPDRLTKYQATIAPRGVYSESIFQYFSALTFMKNIERTLLFTEFHGLSAQQAFGVGLANHHAYFISGFNFKKDAAGHTLWFIEIYNPAGKRTSGLPSYKKNSSGGYLLTKSPSTDGKFELELNDFIRLSSSVLHITHS